MHARGVGPHNVSGGRGAAGGIGGGAGVMGGRGYNRIFSITWFADSPLLERYFQNLDYSNLTQKHHMIPADVRPSATEELF